MVHADVPKVGYAYKGDKGEATGEPGREATWSTRWEREDVPRDIPRILMPKITVSRGIYMVSVVLWSKLGERDSISSLALSPQKNSFHSYQANALSLSTSK